MRLNLPSASLIENKDIWMNMAANGRFLVHLKLNTYIRFTPKNEYRMYLKIGKLRDLKELDKLTDR